MSGDKCIYLSKNQRFIVWSNRVEAITGFWIFKKMTTIPIKKISSIKAHELREVIEIAADDGTTYVFSVPHPNAARDAIISLL